MVIPTVDAWDDTVVAVSSIRVLFPYLVVLHCKRVTVREVTRLVVVRFTF